MSSDQFRQLTRDPRALMRFQATGQLPRPPEAPNSPLITLLGQIGPGLLTQIRGLTVDSRLGYQGSRGFATAAQARTWLTPTDRFQKPHSASWQNKRFTQPLYLEDLAACCAQPLPQFVMDRCAHLRRPVARVAEEPPAAGEAPRS